MKKFNSLKSWFAEDRSRMFTGFLLTGILMLVAIVFITIFRGHP